MIFRSWLINSKENILTTFSLTGFDWRKGDLSLESRPHPILDWCLNIVLWLAASIACSVKERDSWNQRTKQKKKMKLKMKRRKKTMKRELANDWPRRRNQKARSKKQKVMLRATVLVHVPDPVLNHVPARVPVLVQLRDPNLDLPNLAVAQRPVVVHDHPVLHLHVGQLLQRQSKLPKRGSMLNVSWFIDYDL